MEVHHHPHLHHKPKKWKEYFLEFLMIFLAVTMGFFAENIREHRVEKNREAEYIKSLSADLSDDIHNLDSLIMYEQTEIQRLDTLIDLLVTPALAKQNGDELYYVARMGPREQPFAVNSRTLDQLKSSGGFLLIKNVDASNRIISYYNQYAPVKLLEDNYDHEFDNYKRVAAKIFNAAILRRQENKSGDIMRSHDNPALLNYDENLLKELAFHVLQMGGSRRSRLNMLEMQKNRALSLRSYLRREYNLKDIDKAQETVTQPTALSADEKEVARKEISGRIEEIIRGVTNLDVNMALKPYSDDTSFRIVNPDASVTDYQTMKNSQTAFFRAVKSMSFATAKEDFLFLSKDLVLCTWTGKNEFELKAGGAMKIDPYVGSKLFSKINHQWEIVYAHESAAQPVKSEPGK